MVGDTRISLVTEWRCLPIIYRYICDAYMELKTGLNPGGAEGIKVSLPN